MILGFSDPIRMLLDEIDFVAIEKITLSVTVPIFLDIWGGRWAWL
jgi:hypothetical protein